MSEAKDRLIAELLEALIDAEGFITGFEDDEGQEPSVNPMLARIRTAIANGTDTYVRLGHEEKREAESAMTVAEVFAKTDWAELALQKLTLITACDAEPILEGMLNWIDALQDAAEQDGHPVVWLVTPED
jgi:hypothetical protein